MIISRFVFQFVSSNVQSTDTEAPILAGGLHKTKRYLDLYMGSTLKPNTEVDYGLHFGYMESPHSLSPACSFIVLIIAAYQGPGPCYPAYITPKPSFLLQCCCMPQKIRVRDRLLRTLYVGAHRQVTLKQ